MEHRNAEGLFLKIHGAPRATVGGPDGPAINGARNIALLALLATTPDQRRSRSTIVDMLWTDNSGERGRANLRQLLHALRQSMGAEFDKCIEVTRDSVALKAGSVTLLGGPGDGLFLEGLDLPQEGFEDWLRDMRLATPSPPAIAEPVEHILPRVLVLPFAEVHDGDGAGVGDALAYVISGTLARSQLVDAISHLSGRQIERDQAGGLCDYVLSGQVRLSGTSMTIDAMMMDVPGRTVVWADVVQTELAGFLAGEDAAVRELVGPALREIVARSMAASASTPLPDLAAHELMVSAIGMVHSFDRRLFQRAEEQLGEVINRCPAAAAPRAWLAQWRLLRVYQKWSDDPALDTRLANDSVRAALDLDPASALSLAIHGNIKTILEQDLDSADQAFTAAMEVNPSSALISQLASVLATFRGDGQKAVALADRAFMLSPKDPRRPFFQSLSAGSYVAGGRYEEAVLMAEASIRHSPLHLSAHRCRVIALQLSGREREARSAVADLLRLDPGMTVSGYLRNHPSANTPVVETWGDALRRAGVPAN